MKYVWKPIKYDDGALEYVPNQAPKICINALKKNGIAIKYITGPTDELIAVALNNNLNSIRYIKN